MSTDDREGWPRDLQHELTRIRIHLDELETKVDGIATQLANDLLAYQAREERREEREAQQAEREHTARMALVQNAHVARLRLIAIVVPVLTALGGVIAGVLGTR